MRADDAFALHVDYPKGTIEYWPQNLKDMVDRDSARGMDKATAEASAAGVLEQMKK